MQNLSQSIDCFFNFLIKENKKKTIIFQNGQKDEVIFKDIYLYINGINLQYFSLNKDKMCSSVYTDFQKIDKYTIEQIVEGDYDLDDVIEKESFEEKKEKKIRFFTVSQINQEIKSLIEQSAFKNIWIEGEISNLTPSSLGHFYLTLKDEDTTLRAVIFRQVSQNIKFQLKNGLSVRIQGDLTVYKKIGSYQIIIKKLEPKGIGSLQLAFEQLKNKLSQEGLFSFESKKTIPQFPSKIAVITSEHGAALQDFLKTTKNIFFDQNITIYPCSVQGDKAPSSIAQKIIQANSHGDYDLLVVTRGGGSIEDLWAFNEEIVARAIYQSKIPIISAVGHEIDYTISDFVADMRVVTPTAAAEIISKGKYQLEQSLIQWNQRMINSFQGQLNRIKNGIKNAEVSRLIYLIKSRITLQKNRTIQLQKDISTQIIIKYQHTLQHYQNLIHKLDALSPLKVLNRGYSVVKDKDNKILKDAKNAAVNDKLSITYYKGRQQVKVLSICPDK